MSVCIKQTMRLESRHVSGQYAKPVSPSYERQNIKVQNEHASTKKRRKLEHPVWIFVILLSDSIKCRLQTKDSLVTDLRSLGWL